MDSKGFDETFELWTERCYARSVADGNQFSRLLQILQNDRFFKKIDIFSNPPFFKLSIAVDNNIIPITEGILHLLQERNCVSNRNAYPYDFYFDIYGVNGNIIGI